MHSKRRVSRQVSVFLVGLAIGTSALVARLALRSVRLASYEQLDQRVASLLARGDTRQAARLVNDALQSCRQQGTVPPGVFAAAALLYGSDGAGRPEAAIRFLEAGLEAGLSFADRPDLRLFYAQLLYRSRRFSDILELYEGFPPETLFVDEHILLQQASRELGLIDRAYRSVLDALCCELDDPAFVRLWGERQELARIAGDLDFWGPVAAQEVARSCGVLAAECERARISGRTEEALRIARRLLATQSRSTRIGTVLAAIIAHLERGAGNRRAACESLRSCREGGHMAGTAELWLALAERELQGQEVCREYAGELLLNAFAASRGPEPVHGEELTRLLKAYVRQCVGHNEEPCEGLLDASAAVLGARTVTACLLDALDEGPTDLPQNWLAALEEYTWRDGAADPDLCFRLARWLASEGAYDRAIRLCRPHLDAIVDVDRLLSVAAWARMAGMHDVQALAAGRARELAVSAGDRLRADVEYALGLISQGQHAAAEPLLRDALGRSMFGTARDRELAGAIRTALAVALAGQGKVTPALGVLRELVGGNGDVPSEARVLYALLLYAEAERLGTPDQRGAIAGSRGKVTFTSQVVERWREVAETLEYVLEECGDRLTPHQRGLVALSAARARIALEEYDEAVRLLERLRGAGREFEQDVLVELADCYYRLGEREKAQACLERMLAGHRDRENRKGTLLQVLELADSALKRLL